MLGDDGGREVFDGGGDGGAGHPVDGEDVAVVEGE